MRPGPLYSIWLFLPALPFVFGFLFLELLYDQGRVWTEPHFAPPETGYPEFFSNLLNYAAFLAYHTITAGLVLGYLIYQTARLDKPIRKVVLISGIGSVLFLVAMTVALRVINPWDISTEGAVLQASGVLDSSFGYVCRQLTRSELLTHLMPETCFDEGFSLFSMMILAQFVLAIFGAILIAPFVYGLATPVGSLPLEERARLIEIAFRLEVLTLVNGTIAIMVLMRLPVGLAPDGETMRQMAGYAQSMTLFWSVQFTIALVMMFWPAVYFLRKMAESQGQEEPVVKDGFAMSLFKDRRRVTHALGVMAPFVVGLAGTAIEQFFGAM